MLRNKALFSEGNLSSLRPGRATVAQARGLHPGCKPAFLWIVGAFMMDLRRVLDFFNPRTHFLPVECRDFALLLRFV